MRWFENMSISKKLMTGFLIVALLAAAVGAVGMMNLNHINQADTALYQEDTLGLQYVGDAGVNFMQLRYYSLKMSYTDPADKAALQETYNYIIRYIDETEKILIQCDATVTDPAARSRLDDIQTNWQSYAPAIQDEMQRRLDGEYFTVSPEVVRMGEELRDGFLQTFEDLSVSASDKSARNTDTARLSMILMAVVIGAAILCSVLLGAAIARMIGVPLVAVAAAADILAVGSLQINAALAQNDTRMERRKDEVGKLYAAFHRLIDGMARQADAVRQVADFDLTADVEIRDENDTLGKELSKLIENLNGVVGSVMAAAEQVASGSDMLSNSSMSLSQGATEQASSVEELTASIEEISAQIGRNAESAEAANALVREVSVFASRGNDRMKEMLRAMDEISVSSGNINKIIKVIDDIAFQTNILALNAAVEAARAGQHGRGFAVVAEEVRSLAARSASAAKETTDLIEGSIRKVESGTRIANETASALDRIVEGVEKTAGLVDSISAASREQAQGIEQVNQGILQVSQVVQTNAALSEESAAASEELSGQAAQLKDAMGSFRVKKQARQPVQETVVTKKAPEAGRQPAVSGKARTKIVLSDGEFGKY